MAVVGTYHPDNGAPAVRYVKNWSDSGTPVTIPRFNPVDLFSSIFGSNEDLDAEAEKEQRRQRSVLDSVVQQYQHLQSDASGLGSESKARIKDHLDRVREYEQRAFGDITGICEVPTSPPDLPLINGQEHHAGIIYDVAEFQAVWRLMADIYVAGIQCDVIRFGNCHFLNVGDRINFQGDYMYNGELRYTFDDFGDTPNETELGNHVNHEHFHAWSNSGSPIQADHHLHMYMNELSYLYQRLDDPAYPDENGGTILDNALMITTTELSDPGAPPQPRCLSRLLVRKRAASGRGNGHGRYGPRLAAGRPTSTTRFSRATAWARSSAMSATTASTRSWSEYR